MAKRARRRPPRPHPRDRAQEAAEENQRLDGAARRLLNGRSREQLQAEVADRERLLADADRTAQLEPNPVTLARYRAARFELAVVQRALALAEPAPASG